MSWTSARKVARLIQEDRPVEIEKTLDSYSLVQRQCITSIKYKRSSLLFIAVVNCRISIVSYFLEICRVDPNSFGYMGGRKLTCLAAAVCMNSETIIRMLLAHGANTELASSYRTTALLYACTQNRYQLAKCLIENGADVNTYNGIGENCLTETINNNELFRYLISTGADVNSVGAFGRTALMLAIENQRNEVISFLLSCANTNVRLKNDCHEDAFCLALRHSSESIVEDIITKGVYTKEEIIQVYELESCIFHVSKNDNKSNELWENALKLRAQLSNVPIFSRRHLAGSLQRVVRLLNTDDAPVLLYLESEYGLNNIFTLQVYTKAAMNVPNVEKYITLCEFFFDTLRSLDDDLFFGTSSQIEQLIQHYFGIKFSSNNRQIVHFFNMFASYTRELRDRFERMTPKKRMHHAHMIECFLYFTIEFIELIYRMCPEEMRLFHEGIKVILIADLRGLRLKSLTQMCGRLHSSFKIMSVLFHCRANVNSADIEGKSVLHEIVESSMSDKDIVELIINNGFDFHLVKCEEYCLPCRMERDRILPNPVKHLSLQCLATRAFCEKTMDSLSDVPYHLLAIVNSHMYLP